MNQHILVPIVLFACVTYAFKAALDAALRYRLVRTGSSEAMVRAVFDGEAAQQTRLALRWGVVLTTLGIGFAIVQALGWNDVTPGSVGIVLAATGIGHLVFALLARRLA